LELRQGALAGLDLIASFPDPGFWRGRRVLLTGHTGFKGSWMALWLEKMGAQVVGFALPPQTDASLYERARVDRGIESVLGDLNDTQSVARVVAHAKPQIVIHMAAQSLVRRALEEPSETVATNVLGTAHLLQALRRADPLEAVLAVTSDKVYANDEREHAFHETDPLGGRDIYSASKAAQELVVGAFRQSYFRTKGVPLATARGGNVLGGGDIAAHRIVPDIVRAVAQGQKPKLRAPNATRPWQHVLDCLCGYLLFAEGLVLRRCNDTTLNFGPESEGSVTVAHIAESMLAALGSSIEWEHVPDADSVEMKTLVVDAARAREALNWRPRFRGDAIVNVTAAWYRAVARGEDPRSVTLRQIDAYVQGG
jgi:CDP-glucose 4,6-dehydratase